MKKTALFLCVVFLFSLLTVTPHAAGTIPVSAEIRTVGNGEFTVTVYVDAAQNAVSLKLVLKYDTARFCLKNAKACMHTTASGDESENLSGMWAFGNLANGTGCVAAFISSNGATLYEKTAVCEFIFTSEDTDFKTEEINCVLSEFITDDGDEKNDIRSDTAISPVQRTEEDVSNVFSYVISNDMVRITSVKSAQETLFVPEKINGYPVRTFDVTPSAQNRFLIFPRSVLNAGESAFSEDCTVVAPFGSAPAFATQKCGCAVLCYYENTVPDLCEPFFYTDVFLASSPDAFFGGSADITVAPSYRVGSESLLGTGTVVTLQNAANELDFTLCVMGDVNGDSVCDVIDIVCAERRVNGLNDFSNIENKSVDFDFDGDVNVADFSALVNIALGCEYTLYEGVRGDLNGDCAVDVLDICAFFKMMNEPVSAQNQIAKADFNNDGVLNSYDLDILCEMVDLFV